MKTLTVKELIKQLRRHPDHTPVYVAGKEDFGPLSTIVEVRLHMYEDKVFIKQGKKLN